MSENSYKNFNSLRRFCFTGIRGTGKTSLLNKVKPQNPEVHCISGSDVLREIMGEEAYSGFEFLPEEEKYAYRLKINERLNKIQISTGKHLLVDSHLTVYNLKTGYIDNIFTHRDYEFYTDLVLLDSTPEKVYQYRIKDTRKKRIVDQEIIEKELGFERETAYTVAEEHGINLHIIQTDEKAIENLNRLLFREI
ncbi:AAA family ATPase [Methanosarcina sp. KYL-1]|uniref:AAA family ATPase n=1 Tax=Methanosarcina sp. KYL-1 TaxID=2602068 RepID=UPI00210158CE|nr:AAA family ATPase [Methanosarcina sp. KYL-1]MCQ1535390.1 AAA family ATPase [Methanosarcina sp. KYL-1]